jgi:SAM-dependent methyltransferase
MRKTSAPPAFLEYSAGLALRCPVCGTCGTESVLHPFATSGNVDCTRCSFQMAEENGIWQAIAPDRVQYFAKFVSEYEHVRKAEGRGSATSEYYLELPFQDLTGSNTWQWSIRSRTHLYIVRNVLPLLTKTKNETLNVLDLGAGNGWLSYRLATLGYSPVAVDLLANGFDGLGAARHYNSALPKLFPRFQAELDNLPFASNQFDCAIFNASFHYSENYQRTLTEAIRCLRPGGTVIIADSPTYSAESVGYQMVEERQKSFRKNFGFASDSLKNLEFLTPHIMRQLADSLKLEWQTHKIWYGFRWASRPMFSRVKRRREPSQFVIYTAQVKK